MNSLFIIGNGFDLAHGLKTSYRDFRKFLVQVEREACAEAGEVSISEDSDLLKEDKVKYNFGNIAIPAIESRLSDLANLINLKDGSTGMTMLEQLDEIRQFLDDADKIVQWVKHGSGQYYIREHKESQAIKQFIAMLEPETGMISHNTKLNTSILLQVIENVFGDTVVNYFQSDIEMPFWFTLRLFIHMTDTIAGKDWVDFETSMGSYNFKLFFDSFKESDIENFLTLLPHNIDMLFRLWVRFTELTFEQQVVSKSIDDILTASRPKIKRTQNGIELSFTLKDSTTKGNLNYIHPLATSDKNPISKKQLLQIFGRAEVNYFFTFNYTQTLERVYGVSESNICHIHGVAMKDSKNSNNVDLGDLIFGHGREVFDTDVTNPTSTAYNINKKPVTQCIVNNRLFFEKLKGVKNIYSYGFSFGDVDMPYVSKICSSIGDTSNVMWYLNDFDPEEHEIFKRKIMASGFKGLFDTFHID